MLAERLAEEQVDPLDETQAQIPSLHSVQVQDVRQGRAEVHGDALCCMLNTFGEKLSVVEIDKLAETLV